MRLETGEHGVLEIREAYVGLVFVTEEGHRYGICMRDDGIEITPSEGAPAPYVFGKSVEEAAEVLLRNRSNTIKECIVCHKADYAFNMHHVGPNGLIPIGWYCCEDYAHRCDDV